MVSILHRTLPSERQYHTLLRSLFLGDAAGLASAARTDRETPPRKEKEEARMAMAAVGTARGGLGLEEVPECATEFVLVRHGETTWNRAHRIQVSNATYCLPWVLAFHEFLLVEQGTPHPGKRCSSLPLLLSIPALSGGALSTCRMHS